MSSANPDNLHQTVSLVLMNAEDYLLLPGGFL